MLILSLGSNLGNREQLMQDAIRALEEHVGTLLKCSSFYTTAPVGFASEHAFLNAVAAFDTNKAPEDVLRITQEIERQLGRTQKSIAGQHFDRTIDIDILAFNDIVITTSDLVIPHPRLCERRFVLEPLCEILPSSLHPIHKTTYKELLHMLNTATICREQTATPTLLDALNHLLSQLSSSAKPLNMEQLSALLANPATQIYTLSDEEGAIKASATLAFQHLLTGTKAWVEDVVVDEAARGRGYARQLLRHLEAEAIAAGAKSLNLTSRPTRQAANHLYQSEGYAIRETNVYRKPIK